MDKLLGKLYRRGNKGIYSIVLFLLWASTIVRFASDWAVLRSGFVVNNDSPIDSLKKLTMGPLILQNIATLLGILIADAILVGNDGSVQVPNSQICRYGAAIYCGITNIF